MTSRRQGGRRKKAGALTRVITREALDLVPFTRLLNTQWAAGDHVQVGNRVAAVIQATAALPYPWVPWPAGEQFAALAAGQTFQYKIWKVQPQDQTPADLRKHGVAWIRLRAADQHGLAAQELDRFFRNPSRDRLRRCQQCARWFIDMTRNKSARRCQRGCTVAWWNSQRTTKRKRGDR